MTAIIGNYFCRGDGMNSISMQSEWATVKEGVLYIGTTGFGGDISWNYRTERSLMSTNDSIDFRKNKKEVAIPKLSKLRGRRLSTMTMPNTPQWIATIDPSGRVNHLDWTDEYAVLEAAVNIASPGVSGRQRGLSHEAVLWSDKLDSWIFLPSVVDMHVQVSTSTADLANDKMKQTQRHLHQIVSGTSSIEPITASRGDVLLIKSSANFQYVSAIRIDVDAIMQSTSPPLPAVFKKGTSTFQFSSAKFLPESGDKIIVAILGVQSATDNADSTSIENYSYVVFIGIDGVLLRPSVRIPDSEGFAFSGLEFL